MLKRDMDNKVLCGVCAGLGREFGIDPVIIRIMFVVDGLFLTGVGFLLYLVLWFAMPQD